MKQGFRAQNRLFGVGGYHTITQWPIVDPGLQKPRSRACPSPFLAGLILKISARRQGQELLYAINTNTDRFPRPATSPHDLTLSRRLDGSQLLWMWLRKVMSISVLVAIGLLWFVIYDLQSHFTQRVRFVADHLQDLGTQLNGLRLGV